MCSFTETNEIVIEWHIVHTESNRLIWILHQIHIQGNPFDQRTFDRIVIRDSENVIITDLTFLGMFPHWTTFLHLWNSSNEEGILMRKRVHCLLAGVKRVHLLRFSNIVNLTLGVLHNLRGDSLELNNVTIHTLEASVIPGGLHSFLSLKLKKDLRYKRSHLSTHFFYIFPETR